MDEIGTAMVLNANTNTHILSHTHSRLECVCMVVTNDARGREWQGYLAHECNNFLVQRFSRSTCFPFQSLPWFTLWFSFLFLVFLAAAHTQIPL